MPIIIILLVLTLYLLLETFESVLVARATVYSHKGSLHREVGVGYLVGRPELASCSSSPGIPFWNLKLTRYYLLDPHNRAFLLTYSHELILETHNKRKRK
jgi:hypothetical protein